MRPKKLILQAFGPFKDRVEIDFNAFGEQGIYLVSGDTGSGKTTLFDGIAYALFGEASGVERNSSMFRSSYADPRTLTKVELDFTHAGKEYHIERIPTQIRKKQRGEGETEEKASGVLEMPGETPLVKLNEIDEKVRDILGIDKSEFTQIVMLAQGEFRKLLSAGTKERESILRNLFKTENFLGFQEKIKELRNQKNNELESAENQLRHDLKKIQFPEFVTDKEQEKRSPESSSEQEILKAIESYLQSDREAEALHREKQNALKKEADLLNASMGKAENFAKIQGDLEYFQKELTVEEEKAVVLKKEKETAEKKQGEIEQLNVEILKLQNEIEEYEKFDNTAKEVDLLKEKCNALYLEWTKEKAQLEKTEKEIAGFEEEIQLYKDTEVELERGRQELKEEELLVEKYVALRKELAELKESKEKLLKLNREFTKLQEEADRLSHFSQKFRSDFNKAQAGILASRLEDGEKCPVCGSVHHPEKALLSKEAPTEEMVKSAEDVAAESNQRSAAKSREMASLQGSHNAKTQGVYEELKKIVGEVSFEEAVQALEKQQGDLLQKKEQLLEKIGKIEKDLKRKKQLENLLPEKKALKEELEGKAGDHNEQLIRQRTEVLEREKACEELKKKLKFENKKAATENLNATKKGKETLEQKIKQAEERYRASVELIAGNKGKIESLKKQLEGQEIPEIQTLKEKSFKLQEAQKENELLIENLSSRIAMNQELLRTLQKDLRKREGIEKEYNVLNPIYQTAIGRVQGKEKMTFESYVQAYYFERIIERANVQLLKMSDGQYEFSRRAFADNRAKKFGLDLDIRDHYNGTERKAVSLSGGESFIAALALALGLSEEVQRFAGGNRFESLFVDEGFGSLDSESLNLVMKALNGLAKEHRIIGIISHVSELENEIDKKVIVKKDKAKGSSVQTVF